MNKYVGTNHFITVLRYDNTLPVMDSLYSAFSANDVKTDLVIRVTTANKGSKLYFYYNEDRRWHEIPIDDCSYYGNTRGYQVNDDDAFLLNAVFNIENCLKNNI